MHPIVQRIKFLCLKDESCLLRASGLAESWARHKQNYRWNQPADSENHVRAAYKFPRRHLPLTSRWNPAVVVHSNLEAPNILIHQKPYIAQAIPVVVGVLHFARQQGSW